MTMAAAAVVGGWLELAAAAEDSTAASGKRSGRNPDQNSRNSELRNSGLRWFAASARASSRSAARRRRSLSTPTTLRGSRVRNRSIGLLIRDFRYRQISAAGSISENNSTWL